MRCPSQSALASRRSFGFTVLPVLHGGTGGGQLTAVLVCAWTRRVTVYTLRAHSSPFPSSSLLLLFPSSLPSFFSLGGGAPCGPLTFRPEHLPLVMASNASNEDGALFCKHCEMWLNGPTQWRDHIDCKKHRKNVRRKSPRPSCLRALQDVGGPQSDPQDGEPCHNT